MGEGKPSSLSGENNDGIAAEESQGKKITTWRERPMKPTERENRPKTPARGKWNTTKKVVKSI